MESSIEEQIEHLMDMNQALQAWDLVKDINHPLKDRVWLKVRHAFDADLYRKYYTDDLSEFPVREDIVYDVTKHDARFGWLLPRLFKLWPNSVLDIGCADGYLGLTLGRWGIRSVGLNLYKPSIDLAKKRADLNRLPAKFLQQDFRDYNEKHDAVVFFEILEHLPNPKEALEKAYSLVKDGGHLYISTPMADKHIGISAHLKDKNRESWNDGKPSGHIQLFTEDEFKTLLKPYNLLDYYVDEEFSMEAEVQK